MSSKVYTYKVQVARGRGAYRTRYTFEGAEPRKDGNGYVVPAQVALYYHGINVGNGYRKRLVCDVSVIAREVSL